jgi:hypothetical protein
MRTSRILALLLAAAITAPLAVPESGSAASSRKVVSFKAHYSGTASVLIDNSAVQVQSIKGTGSASLVGAGSVSGTADGTGANGSCVPFTGPGKLKGTKGTLKFTVNAAKSQGCSSGQSGPVTVTINGIAKVTSGTGAAKGAKGNLKFKGTLKLNDTTGSQSGAFSGTVSGKLTVGK